MGNKKNYFIYFLCAYLVIIPCFWAHGVDMRIAQETAYYLGAMILIAIGLSNPIRLLKNFYCNIWINIFLAWTILIYIYFKFAVGGGTLINILLAVTLYHVCCMCIEKRHMKSIVKTILFVCILNILYVLAQKYLNYDPLWSTKGPNGTVLSFHEPVGFFGLKACLGMYFAIAMPLLAYLNIFTPIISIYPLYIALCSTATIGGPVGFLFYLWKVKRIFFWSIIMLMIVGGVFVIQKDMKMNLQGTRITMWGDTLKTALQKPITGWGLDSFRNTWNDPFRGKNFLFLRIENDKLKNKNVIISNDNKEIIQAMEGNKDLWDNPHNEILQLLFEMGIPGLFFIGMIIYSMFKRYKEAFKSKELIAVTGSLIALIFCSMTQFPFHLSRIGHLVPILLALFMICSEKGIEYET
jgi:O-antigen ligase